MTSGEIMRKTILEVLESDRAMTQKEIAERLQKNIVMSGKEANK